MDNPDKNLLSKRKANELKGIIELIKGRVECDLSHENHCVREAVIPVANGDLFLRHQLLTSHPARSFTSRLPFAYDPDAKCPRFITMLKHMVGDASLPILQLFAGQLLQNRNDSKSIVLLHGPANTGKTTLTKIFSCLAGWESSIEMTARHLNGRFALSAFIGKSFLIGNDVAHDFLQTDGAEQLKSLTGGDTLTVELKGENKRRTLTGTYNVLIAANHQLTINTKGEPTAWMERVIPLATYPLDSRTIKDQYAETLIKDEGAGILNFALEGMRQLEAGRSLRDQKSRNGLHGARLAMLDLPGLIQVFVQERFEVGDDSIATSDILQCFKEWYRGAAGYHLDMPSDDGLGRHLAAALRRHFGSDVRDSTHCLHSNGRGRGYSGIRIKA